MELRNDHHEMFSTSVSSGHLGLYSNCTQFPKDINPRNCCSDVIANNDKKNFVKNVVKHFFKPL